MKPDAPAGLVAWWTFDEPEDSPVALDFSGHRNGGWLEKSRRAAGWEASALVCDGGCVLLPRSPVLGELQKFSIECRVRTDVAAQDNRWLVNSVFNHNTTSGFRLGVLRGKPCFQVPQTAWSHHLSGDEPLPTGQWVHLAATFDGTTMRLYMDGKECGTMSRPGAYCRRTAASFSATTNWTIALTSKDYSTTCGFTGACCRETTFEPTLPGSQAVNLDVSTIAPHRRSNPP